MAKTYIGMYHPSLIRIRVLNADKELGTSVPQDVHNRSPEYYEDIMTQEAPAFEFVTKKLEELEEDFIIVDQDLKDIKIMKIIPEVTYHEWSIKFGHIFDAGIGAEAILKLLERVFL